MQRIQHNPRKRHSKSTYRNRIGRKNRPITDESDKSKSRKDTEFTRKPKKAQYVIRFTTHAETKKTPFELHFGRKPGTKLSNLKNAISIDSKELSLPYLQLRRRNHGPPGDIQKEKQ